MSPSVLVVGPPFALETSGFSSGNEVHHETHRTMLDRHRGDVRDGRRCAGSVGENLPPGVSSGVQSGVSPGLALANGGLPADDFRHHSKPAISWRNGHPSTTRVPACGRLVVTKVPRLNQPHGALAQQHTRDFAEARRQSLDGCRVRAQQPTAAVHLVRGPGTA